MNFLALNESVTFEHEAALILERAEPVPDGDGPHAVVRDLDGLDVQLELARLAQVRDGDAVVARHFAVVVKPGGRAGVGVLVNCS